jgi:putative PIN family toxin of toxin-antitoxin system
MIRAVVDTNVIVSGLLTPFGKPPFLILQLIRNFEIALFVSDDILSEYERVLNYKKFENKITKDEIKEILHFLGAGININPPKSTFAFSDETDRVFYDLAKASNSYLITGNLKHYPPEGKIVPPVKFLEIYFS